METIGWIIGAVFVIVAGVSIIRMETVGDFSSSLNSAILHRGLQDLSVLGANRADYSLKELEEEIEKTHWREQERDQVSDNAMLWQFWRKPKSFFSEKLIIDCFKETP